MAGVIILKRIGASNAIRPRKEVISCAAPTGKAAEIKTTLSTVQSGNWSNPSTWGGKVPAATDTPLIATGHEVVFDMETATVAGLHINSGAALKFAADKSSTLQSSQNILLEGKLVMKPSKAAVRQTLRFINVNENAFIGGGLDMLEPDTGLWVMNDGQMNCQGAKKTSWTRAKGTIAAGAKTITLKEAPQGWQTGDEITIAPTEPPTVGDACITGFDEHIVTAVNGAAITLNKSTVRPHPKVNNQWTAEVMNLTRNVRIEGTKNGHAHIFIRSGQPQYIQYVSMRHMGPRKDRNKDGVKDRLSGRYALHFHYSYDGSRGSTVEGCVVRDTNNSSYVPHLSHGISFRRNIAYNIVEPAFWWDLGDVTHDTLWEYNIVALNKFEPRGLTLYDTPSYLNTAYELGKGDNNIARHNVAVGVQSIDSGSYDWEANNDGVWEFTDNLSHNSDMGIRVWQNSTFNHIIKGFKAYHNKTGIFHGAYANCFKYDEAYLYGNLRGIEIKAASNNSSKVRIENSLIDGAGMAEYGIEIVSSPLDGMVPLFLRNLTLQGHSKAGIIDASGSSKKSVDVIGCTISAPEFYMMTKAMESEVIRVQPVKGQPFQLKRADQPGALVQAWNARRTDIKPFAPSIWGTGTGLQADYFNDNSFTKKVFTRVDPLIAFTEWGNGVHHAITGNNYAVRWTGHLQPQYSEEYLFHLQAGGGHRLYINDQLLINGWFDSYPGYYTSIPVALKAGELYDIRLEYFNTNQKSGIGLLWSSCSQPEEYIPQTQLYAGTGKPVAVR